MANSNSNNTRGGKKIGNDVKFKPGDSIGKEVIVDVTNQPLNILGVMPEGHTVSVFRVYAGENECIDIPEMQVMCRDGCTPLMLFNVENPECGNGRYIQNSIWLFYQGRYRLEYTPLDENITEVPEDIYVWCRTDNLVPDLGINLPLCGENSCPPECTPESVMELGAAAFPTADPDCLRCETPVAFHHDLDEPCDTAIYFWSKSPSSLCSDPGEWKELKFSEWLDALGGIIGSVSASGDDVASVDIQLERIPGTCVGRALAINVAVGCPPATSDIEVITEGGEYRTTRPVWTCNAAGLPGLADIVFRCPTESGLITIQDESGQLRSDAPVWTCDAAGNPVRSDLIITCPREDGIVQFSTEGGELRSDRAVWTCDAAGNPVRSDLVIQCPDESGLITVQNEGGELRSDRPVWTCDGAGNPIRSDFIIRCPREDGVVTIQDESGQLRSDGAVWTCDANGNPVRSDLVIQCPREDGINPIQSESDQMRSQFPVWTCDGNGLPVLKDLVMQCPPIVESVVITGDGQPTQDAFWTCDENGNPVRKQLTYEDPEPPEPVDVCAVMNSFPRTATPVDSESVDLIYIDGAGNCRKGPVESENCCPAAIAGATSIGGAVCVEIDPVTAGLRGNIVYQARDNTFLTGGANIGVLGGPGIITISDANPFPDSPAIARIIVKGHSRHRALGTISEDDYDKIDISYLYQITDVAAAPLPPYFDLNLDSSVISASKGRNINNGTQGNPAGAGAADLFDRAASTPLMVKDVVVPIGGSVTQFAQWWLVIDPSNLASAASVPSLFFHGEMTASILWLRSA